MKHLLLILCIVVGFTSCTQKVEIQHRFYGAILGQTEKQFCDSLDKNGIAYEKWSQSYLDYDQIEIQNPELAGYKFTESVFEVNRNSKIVYCARFKLEKINKKFYEDFLIKLEEKYPLVKEEKPDLYQGDFGYEGELHNYSFGNYAISYIYYAPQETIEVVYFYIASQIGNEL